MVKPDVSGHIEIASIFLVIVLNLMRWVKRPIACFYLFASPAWVRLHSVVANLHLLAKRQDEKQVNPERYKCGDEHIDREPV